MLVFAFALSIAGAGAFHPGSVPNNAANCASAVDDARRREFLGALLSTVAVRPSRANARNSDRNVINGVRDPRLRDYYTELLPHWRGTSLPGPLSLSEACARIDGGDPAPVLDMGRWPDPILRHPASPVPSSIFQNQNALAQLRSVAGALRNTARTEGAVGLAAQQCGVDASLIFIDGVNMGTSSNGRRSDIIWGEANGAFGQSGWRKSRKEISGEGASVDDDFPTPKSRPVKQRDRLSKREEGIFLVNPRIVHRSPESEMLTWTEQCLVLPPEFRATLLRDAEVTVEYESLECLNGDSRTCGSTKQITFQGELARCTQHEMDHDRGTLIVDHVSLDELLSCDGEPFMADIENADGLHPERMERAYSRDVSDSKLLSSGEKYVALAMEDELGYRARVKQVGNQYVYEDRKRPWFVQSANAIDRGDRIPSTPAATTGPSSNARINPTQSGIGTNPECDDDYVKERRRIVEERRAMMQQSRSNTRRADVLKLSEQRATLYGTGFKGLSPQTCARPGFCP